jgi:hypothetical protein
MNKAIIFQPAKTAMQSGKAKTRVWLLEFERNTPMTPDALMGWTTMSETVPQQLHLKFATKEEAIAYAETHGITYSLREPKVARIPAKAYAENFAFTKRKAFSGN